MRDYIKAERQYLKELKLAREKDLKILTEAKKHLSKRAISFLSDYMEECDNHFDYNIVDEPNGNKQDEGEGFFVWVNQYVNGGYLGDDFEGDCYFELNNGKYFKWSYWC